MIYVVTVLPDGTRVPVRPGETVLDASRRYGFSYTVGCREGGCGGCALELEPPWCADFVVLADRTGWPDGGSRDVC